MKNKRLKGEEIYNEKKEEVAKIFEKIYSQRESPHSPGSFRFERAREINKPAL